ncbi:3'-5'-bisphosphate nucleotidase [[Actinobacillus] muris]|uniref:3'(2'),5'-bisphosphate nucleotidase CysQ n=1 Tax=Muribacter muris TaxID=67855 RepID=A0A0J5P3F6_9PAST|nr:3'(2'),5'-bisphosphate nucleotidase CysQ [Muribacter muris]KMK51013.1 3'-5'-bisphosphate nucleotidase [[Actinobacillus] muris] [Muribacter muris]
MQPLTPQLLDQVLAIATQAGEHLRRFYAQSVRVEIKPDHTPVTEADLFLSRFVSEQLTALTPHIPVLSEEQCKIPLCERADWQQYWLIDPLDGTQQFIDRTDQFAVVICLVQQNRPVLGVIHAPLLNKTYYACVGNGAFLRESRQVVALPLCKKSHPTDRLLITMGSTNSEKVRQAVQPPYQADFFKYGSSSLKAGLVAEGKADCYIRLGDTGEWDTGAAEVILRECGGAIFDLHFQPLSYNQRESFVNPHFMMVANAQWDWQRIIRFN